jgi:hypothetical protein
MLPIMVFSLCFCSFSFLGFLRSLQNSVEEIWLDKSGGEIKVVYRNRGYRKFRGAQQEEKLINTVLTTPKVKMESLKGINNFFI